MGIERLSIRPQETPLDLTPISLEPTISTYLVEIVISLGTIILQTLGTIIFIYAVTQAYKRFTGPSSGSPSSYGRDLTKAAGEGEFNNLILTERDEANLDKINKCFKNAKKCNLFIMGPEGSGKETTIHFLAKQISEKSCDPSLKDRKIIELDPSALIGGASFIGEFQGRVRDFFNFIKKENAILYIPSLQKIQNERESSNANKIESIEQLLLPFLKRKAFSCIIRATNNNSVANTEFRKYFKDINIPIRSKEESLAVINKAQKLSSFLQNEAESIYDCIQTYLPFQGRLHAAMKIFKKINKNTKATIEKIDLLSALKKVTGIPFAIGDNQWLLDLKTSLKNEIIGQDVAIEVISQSVKTYLTGYKNSLKPIGVFLLVGPTGTGKTQTAKTIANIVFKQRQLIRFDMPHLDRTFKAELSEKLLISPFSVVLLDEIDKAPHEVLPFFLSIFDEGYFIDEQGSSVDCRQALFLMTANTGAFEMLYEKELKQKIQKKGFQIKQDDLMQTFIEEKARQSYSPELMGRINQTILFRPLTQESIKILIIKELQALKNEWGKYPHRLNLDWDESAIACLNREYKREKGARSIIDALVAVRSGITQYTLEGKLLKNLRFTELDGRLSLLYY